VSDFDPERFVYVKIQDSVGPIDRSHKYEDELQEALTARGLGSITGGGSQLGDDGADGIPTIAFCGLDIDAANREAVLALLRDGLPNLGAPVGTEIHYTAGGIKLQDEFRPAGWAIGLPRSFLHPYFES
jgi:hypothetical protein